MKRYLSLIASEDIAILSHHNRQTSEILNITQLSQDTQKGYTFNNTNLSIKHEAFT